MKLTNKQHTDYCEILNNFRCKAIDIIDDLTKAYKDTLAEDIDAKLNNYKQHNEELIVKICQLEQLQNQKAIECLKEVKEQILKFEEIHYQFLGNGTKIPMVTVLNFRIKEVIDTKIKELEGEEKEC